MNTFDNIKTNWQKQQLGDQRKLDVSTIKSKLSKLKKNQSVAPIILGLTIVILLGFLFSQPESSFKFLKTGILLMAGSLLIRMIFEFWSTAKLNNLDITAEFSIFYNRLTEFQRTRKWIHFIITPIVLIIYMLAFYSLLPVFKKNMSEGMYQYIIWSSVIFFSVMIIFKTLSIPKELKILKELNSQFKGEELSEL